MRRLPDIPASPSEVLAWVGDHLDGLATGPVLASDIRGGQQAADTALASFDVAGYARTRNEVWPVGRRGASGLSPYIRHGLLDLPRVWRHVGAGPTDDVLRFRDELLWQEYARHVYARLGDATRRSLRFSVPEHLTRTDNPWLSQAACLSAGWTELTERGWLPNQVRMWLASHWTVREEHGWRDGEDLFFRHLLDGSRAANRVGWQWTVGALTGKPYGFSRWQVTKRAPTLCATCPLETCCPIGEWPEQEELSPRAAVDSRVRRDPDVEHTAGPSSDVVSGRPDAVWITAESLGDDDPALAHWPDLPAVFVFDEPLLRRLRLSTKRLAFLAETLADIATRREVEVWLGDPVRVLTDRRLAATFTAVPGWRTRSQQLDIVALHPWRWLVRPHSGPVTSFTAWSRSSGGIRG